MKRIIPVIIATALLCVVFTADTVDADTTYMFINGHTVTGDETNTEEGWSFNVSSRTLTLNNATLDDALYSSNVTHVDSTIYYCLNGTFNIVLIGDSTIDAVDGPGWFYYAIYAERTVTISGDGSLTINAGGADGTGIYSYRGDVTITGGEIVIDADCGIHAENVMDGDGGHVYITRGSICTNGPIIGYSCLDMTGGSLTVSGMAADEAAVSFEDTVDLHGATTVNATVTAKQIKATEAGSVEIFFPHTVTYDANGGTCATPSDVTGIGCKLSSLPDATCDGHSFDGWFTESSGGTQISEATMFDADTTVYAHWTPDSPPAPEPTPVPEPTPAPDPEPNPSDSGDDKKNDTGLIVGGIIGGIAAVAIIAGVVIFFVKKK